MRSFDRSHWCRHGPVNLKARFWSGIHGHAIPLFSFRSPMPIDRLVLGPGTRVESILFFGVFCLPFRGRWRICPQPKVVEVKSGK